MGFLLLTNLTLITAKKATFLSKNDTFEGKLLHITFDAEHRDGKITDQQGNILPSINSFWFAWYALETKNDRRLKVVFL
jgi:hypothetical protein